MVTYSSSAVSHLSSRCEALPDTTIGPTDGQNVSVAVRCLTKELVSQCEDQYG